MSTKAIEYYLQTAYSDEHLTALLAHAEDGKLSYWSCCCFIGIPTAEHALRGRMNSFDASIEPHYQYARLAAGAEEAEDEYIELDHPGGRGPERLIPIIRAEMARRESLATHNVTAREYGDSVRDEELAGVLTR